MVQLRNRLTLLVRMFAHNYIHPKNTRFNAEVSIKNVYMQDSTATTIELRTSSNCSSTTLFYFSICNLAVCFFGTDCDPKVCKEIKRVTNHTNNNIIALESNWE